MERLNRQTYFLWRLGLIPLLVVMSVAQEGDTEGATFLLLVLIAGIEIALSIGRLHDLDRSGWWSLLGFVPFVNICLGIYLLFAKGTDGENEYGEDPLKPAKK